MTCPRTPTPDGRHTLKSRPAAGAVNRARRVLVGFGSAVIRVSKLEARKLVRRSRTVEVVVSGDYLLIEEVR